MLGVALVSLALGLGACQAKEKPSGSGPGGTFGAISATDTIHLVGTEPFWGGQLTGTTLRYTTPDDPKGAPIAVVRFAGNNGLGFSGSFEGKAFDLAITPGACVDGMSDRRYPFVATLRSGDEQRDGCAWTDRQPFSGRDKP